MHPKKTDIRMMLRAQHEGQFSTCPVASVGCVIAKGDLVVSTGYNGAPRGLAHCTDEGCVVVPAPTTRVRRRYKASLENMAMVPCDDGDAHDTEVIVYEVVGREYSRHVHAEANAIAAAARYGRATINTTAYVTIPPCIDCLKLLIQAGISRLVYSGGEDHLRTFFDGGAFKFALQSGLQTSHIASV